MPKQSDSGSPSVLLVRRSKTLTKNGSQQFGRNDDAGVAVQAACRACIARVSVLRMGAIEIPAGSPPMLHFTLYVSTGNQRKRRTGDLGVLKMPCR